LDAVEMSLFKAAMRLPTALKAFGRNLQSVSYRRPIFPPLLEQLESSLKKHSAMLKAIKEQKI